MNDPRIPAGEQNGDNRRLLWPALGLPLLALILLLQILNANAAAPAQEPEPLAFGGGEYEPAHVPHLTSDERAAIQRIIDRNVADLIAQGNLLQNQSTASVALAFPLTTTNGFTDPGFYGITNFVDHNPAYPNRLLDYACGFRTYDTSSGYNHRGTDYYLWPFGWNKMDAGEIAVVAAADGVIVLREDGHNDRSCGFNGQRWNAVYIRHADGSVAWYGHLKRGSVTNKQVGDRVETGEYLGIVGSSGNSTGPHLHLELQDANRKLIDPYAGSCNALNPTSWWQEQPDYRDPGVNKMTTGPAPASFQACPQPDITNESSNFQPGDTIYFSTYYHDQVEALPSVYRIYRPDGSLYTRWEHASPKTYTLSYWWWSFRFSAGVPTGTWYFEVTFADQTYRRPFYLGDPSTPTPTATVTLTPTATLTPTVTPTASPTATPVDLWYLPYQERADE